MHVYENLVPGATYWSDDCKVWKMAASGARMIGKDHVSFSQTVPHLFHLVLHRFLHCTQMNWNVRSIGY